MGMHTYMLLANTSTVEMGQLFHYNPFNHKKRKLLNSSQRKQQNQGIQMRTYGANPMVHQDGSARVATVTDYYRNWTDYFGTSWTVFPCYPVDPTCDGYFWSMYPQESRS